MGALSSCHPGHAAHEASRVSPRGSLDIGIVAPDSKSNVHRVNTMKNPALFCFPSPPESHQSIRNATPRSPNSLQRPPSTHITIHHRHARRPTKVLQNQKQFALNSGAMQLVDDSLWPSSTSSSPVAPSPTSVTPPASFHASTQNVVHMTGFAMMDEIDCEAHAPHSKTQTQTLSNTTTNSSKLPFPADHDDIVAGDSNSSKLQHPIVADKEQVADSDSETETDEGSMDSDDHDSIDASLRLPSSMEETSYVILITSNSLNQYQYNGSALAGPVAAKAQHGLDGDEELLP